MDIQDLKNYINIWNKETQTFEKQPITKKERIKLIQDTIKYPGELNLNEDILIATKVASYFDSKGYYTNLVSRSRDWISFWEKQKEISYTGAIIGDWYITGDCYWYWNFIRIPNKVAKTDTFPAIYDMDIWFYQLLELSELTDKYTITLKKRQSGFSLKMLAKIIKRWWFEIGFVGRIGAYDEKPISDDWAILTKYYNHIHSKTGWKRPKTGKKYDWMQQVQLNDGTSRGNMSILQGVVCSKDAAKLVGGKVDEILLEEAGKFPNLDVVIGFAKDALWYGSVKTGNLNAFGAVGELKQSGPMKKFFYDPEENDFLPLENIWSKQTGDKPVGIFIPAYYAFHPHIDEYGNSLIKEAKEELTVKAEKEKKRSYKDFMLYKSQRPLTPEDAFAERDENDFPVHIIQPHYDNLVQNYKPLKVELFSNGVHNVQWKLGSDRDIVTDFPVKKNTDKHGVVVIDEMPHPNAPINLYYAGVDTISPIQSSSSVSLQSVYIYKAAHDMDGEFSADKIVAWYAGRPDEVYGAFEISKNLINFYNARAGIENDNRNFIEWMIKERQQKHIMRRNEFPLSKDILASSTISNVEYGIRTGNKAMKEYLISLAIEYVREEIGVRFDEESGESKTIYGVERIKDQMLLKEMLEYSPKKNVDRIVAFSIALFASRSNTNRGIKVVSKKKTKTKVKQTTPFSSTIRSPFIR